MLENGCTSLSIISTQFRRRKLGFLTSKPEMPQDLGRWRCRRLAHSLPGRSIEEYVGLATKAGAVGGGRLSSIWKAGLVVAGVGGSGNAAVWCVVCLLLVCLYQT